jgi:hypothetical protein
MRPARVLLGSAIVVAFLAGCSGDPPPGPGPGPGSGDGGGSTTTGPSVPDPCTLVTKDAVAAAVGGALEDPLNDLVSAPGFEGGRQCTYRTADGRGQFSLTIFPVTPELFAIDKQQSMGSIEDVAGLGDAAFTVGYTSLHVLQGTYLLQLGLAQVKYDPDESLQHLNTLAKASLAQL